MAILEGKDDGHVIDTIKAYFKQNEYPRPVTIKASGRWAMGYVYAVTTGLFRVKHFAVYMYADGSIKSVRERRYK